MPTLPWMTSTLERVIPVIPLLEQTTILPAIPTLPGIVVDQRCALVSNGSVLKKTIILPAARES